MRSQIFLLLKSHPCSPKTAFSIAFEVAGESIERIEKKSEKSSDLRKLTWNTNMHKAAFPIYLP